MSYGKKKGALFRESNPGVLVVIVVDFSIPSFLQS